MFLGENLHRTKFLLLLFLLDKMCKLCIRSKLFLGEVRKNQLTGEAELRKVNLSKTREDQNMFYLLFAFFLLSSFRSFMAAREEQEFLNLFYLQGYNRQKL